ncbi:flavin-containing monooxygenase [Puerhibacterium sp. TATVAM-FAB25]|uniref:flavin-containing monooxygenase n=1 Tax=Puerhibacterium sp. TATVAM-FAB25 TaxID=3093699 RepID=UPI0039786E25
MEYIEPVDWAGQDVVVIGSGPAGLACAAELGALGVSVVVLEKGETIAAAWATRHDGLRFNTSRLHSALPGAPFPRSFGQFPSRDQYVGYLKAYAQDRGVQVELGCEVVGLEPGHGGGWVVDTVTGRRLARHVVVATGIYRDPVIPSWARGADRGIPVMHSVEYRNAVPFEGRDVVVVGAGSTGMEMAWELAQAGAGAVYLSVRTPPNVLLRVMGGLPGDLPVPLFLHLPTALVDAALRRLQRVVIGDLAPYGLPAPAEGVIAGLKRRGAGTAIVDGEVLDAIREGAISVVPAVTALQSRAAVLSDGTRLPVDAVLLATGFTPGLDRLVGQLGVLDADGMPWDGAGAELRPGLRFVGYVYRPGLTGLVGKMAKRVARDIAGRQPALTVGSAG